MNLIKKYLHKKNLSKNEQITKKDFFYGFLFSPVAGALFVSFIYLIKAVSFYFDNSNQLIFNEVIFQSFPFLIGFAVLLNYSYFMYKYKCFYMSVSGSLIIRSLIFILFLLVGSFLFEEFDKSMIAIAIFLNFSILLLSLTNDKKDTLDHFPDNNRMCFRFIFMDCRTSGKVTTFVKNMNIFYYADYAMFKHYKINYKDVSMLENQFNKKLYDFNQDELAVVTMYAFK